MCVSNISWYQKGNKWYATYFFLKSFIIISYCMLAQMEENCPEPLSKTDGSFHFARPSITATDYCSTDSRTLHRTFLLKQDSQPTLPELPVFGSRALDFEEGSSGSPLETQLEQLAQRFAGIHATLIDHSRRESELHERKRGFKPLPLDPRLLIPDYHNKTAIIADLVTLGEAYEADPPSVSLQDAIETKFLQYYLQRHYGGLNYECNNLSIQERLQREETEREEESSGQENGENAGLVISQLQGCDSLVRESNIYMELGCGTEEENPLEEQPHQERYNEVIVERVKIIEVEIPVLVFRTKEVKVQYEESDLNSHVNNIDSIINRYSKPYSHLFQKELLQPPAEPSPASPDVAPNASSNIIASIMIDSTHHNLRPKQTEIQLIYSDFPEEHTFKLPLDSYAQLESLISHEDSSSTGKLSRPPTDRDNLIPTNEEGITITEKGANRSLLQRIQQNERILNEQNLELKEALASLQTQVSELQAQNRELSSLNQKLSGRLQEEIQQSYYLSAKLNELNAEILEERVECLTHLNATLEHKINGLEQKLAASSAASKDFVAQLAQLEEALQVSNDQLLRKQEELRALSLQLAQREEEVRELEGCENEVIEIAVSSEDGLRREIQRLEAEKGELQEEVKEYRRRMRTEGINLLYDQATEIQGIIQSREHSHQLQLRDVQQRYQEMIIIYQEEVQHVKKELQQMRDLAQAHSRAIASRDATQHLRKITHQRHLREFEELVEQYDRELEQKDEQILTLKNQVLPEEELMMLLERFTATITLLEAQLSRERAEKAQITSKFIEFEQQVRKELSQHKEEDNDTEERIIEELSLQLQRKMAENRAIKDKLAEQATIIGDFLQQEGTLKAATAIKRENQKLREINQKLKRYNCILEEEIKAVCNFDECQSHRTCVNNLIDQKNYFFEMLTKEQALPLEVRAGF